MKRSFDPTLKNLRKSGTLPHAISVIHLVSAALSITGPPETLYSMLEDVGRRHTGYGGVKAHYLPLMGQAFVHAMKEVVVGQQKWSHGLQAAWEEVFNLMNSHIVKGALAHQVDD